MSDRTDAILKQMKNDYFHTGVARETCVWYNGWLNGLTYGNYIDHKELATLLVENEKLYMEYSAKQK